MVCCASTQALRASELSSTFAAEFSVVKGEVKTVVFKSSLHCKNCMQKVQENLAFEKGVKGLEISLEKNTIKLTYDPKKTSEEKLAAAIRKLGYKAEK
ncbi:MAG: heavy-metal-associated domain-containing protein [Bacteroidales bacterium]|nr:heavy-metal-associated domain-containing protein [Bacteroidales bacterium]